MSGAVRAGGVSQSALDLVASRTVTGAVVAGADTVAMASGKNVIRVATLLVDTTFTITGRTDGALCTLRVTQGAGGNHDVYVSDGVNAAVRVRGVALKVGQTTDIAVFMATADDLMFEIVARGEPLPPPPAAPVNTSVPVITGLAEVGQTLEVSTGGWTGAPTPVYSYQWKRSGAAISGATLSTYVLVTADIGTGTISCTVTATNASGSASATSAAVTVVAGGATFDPVTAFGTAPALYLDPRQDTQTDNLVLATLADRSGSAHPMTTTGSPVLKTAIINGKAVYRFDGSTQWAKTAAFTLNQPETVFMVVRDRASSARTLLDGNAVNTMVLTETTGPVGIRIYGGAAYSSPLTVDWTIPHHVELVFNGASSELRIDGATPITGSFGTANAGGVHLAVAGNEAGNAMAPIDVAMLLIYPFTLTASQRGQVEAWARTVWGTP